MKRLPAIIPPELIREGDTISVKLPRERGLTIHHEGTVASIEDYAGGRFFKTAEGTRIAVYVPGRNNQARYTLIARKEQEQVSLW